MTKLEIFIDFEAISAPFSSSAKIKRDLPYAYSIGIHLGKVFKTKTTIIDFNIINLESIFEFIRLDIIKNIRKMIDKKEFKVNKSTIKFIGWSPNLEKRILYKTFKGIEVVDQVKGKHLSLSSLTKKEFESKVYFETFKKEVLKKLDPIFIEKRGLNFDGALAALAGYIIYCNAKSIDKKYDVNIDTSILLEEIRDYSNDDIVRMSYLKLNPNVFKTRSEELAKINKRKQFISSKVHKLTSIHKYIQSLNQKLTLEELGREITNELKEFQKERDNF